MLALFELEIMLGCMLIFLCVDRYGERQLVLEGGCRGNVGNLLVDEEDLKRAALAMIILLIDF